MNSDLITASATKVEQLVVAPGYSYANDPLLFQGMDPRTAEMLLGGLAAAGRELQGLGELGGRLLGSRIIATSNPGQYDSWLQTLHERGRDDRYDLGHRIGATDSKGSV